MSFTVVTASRSSSSLSSSSSELDEWNFSSFFGGPLFATRPRMPWRATDARNRSARRAASPPAGFSDPRPFLKDAACAPPAASTLPPRPAFCAFGPSDAGCTASKPP